MANVPSWGGAGDNQKRVWWGVVWTQRRRAFENAPLNQLRLVRVMGYTYVLFVDE